MRVEGSGDTLAAAHRRARPTTTPVVKDGNDAHSCTGTSVAGALEVATRGNWSRPVVRRPRLRPSTSILGESHTFGSGHYWGEFVNGVARERRLRRRARAGRRGPVRAVDADRLRPGAGRARCTCRRPRPRRRARRSASRSRRRSTTFDSSPAFDAAHGHRARCRARAVGGATTDANGVAAVTLAATPALRAIHDGEHPRARPSRSASRRRRRDLRDDAAPTCRRRRASTTATTASAARPTTSRTYGVHQVDPRAPALPPRATARASSQGTSDPDPSGLKDVQLRLTRNDRGRCSTFSGTRAAVRPR